MLNLELVADRKFLTATVIFEIYSSHVTIYLPLEPAFSLSASQQQQDYDESRYAEMVGSR